MKYITFILFCLLSSAYKCEILTPDVVSNDDSIDSYDEFFIKPKFRGKFLKPISGENNEGLENAVFKSTMDDINRNFKTGIENIKRKTKRVDIVFLIDSSSSVGKVNFISETRFVKKLLSEFNVSFNYTRVALVTFSSQGKVVRHIDQISDPSVENDKCKLLNDEMPQIKFVGGGTYTYGALAEAKDIFDKARRNSKKIIFLVTDGFSNGKNPVPMAINLKNNNVTIFTIGIQSGNYIELHNISSSPEKEHNFLLDSFMQFESLARKALHADYKIGHSLKLTNDTRCNALCEDSEHKENGILNCCDGNAVCTCGTSSGHYACQCNPGYYGSGLQCNLCPNGTYWHNSNMCRPCPDINHITVIQPALNVSYCVCKTGFKQTADNRCEGITCPKLLPPQNGYFVKQPTSCANVLHAACGARCKSGYQLTGTSLRLCQENGTWSGVEASCALKTCPSLVIPYYGLAICRNKDLNVFFDYSPRNTTFMKSYEIESKRVTEPLPIDTDCTYKCGPGYYLVGSRSRNCLPLSKWDGLQTTCKQVLCSPLPKPTYGDYGLSDCVEQKVPYGTNCTLLCPDGFTIRGPATKSCAGKKNGIWTHKSKNAKCVDITPPSLTCPPDISVFVEEVNDFAVIQSLPIPSNISDTTGRNVTHWLMQTVNSTNGIKLNIGNHTFTYIASDSFNNKANCSFTVRVIDKIAPVIENCEDPEELRVMNAKTDFIDWEEPIFYDNSNTKIRIQKSMSPGIIGVGHHKVKYIATDIFNNSNSCTINVTVKEVYCEPLKSPLNGQILCAKNITHTWCQIICNSGFAVFDNIRDDHFETLNLTCLNETPDWKFESNPDCTPLNLPNTIEQILTIPLDSDYDDRKCENSTMHTEIEQVLTDHLKSYMCQDIEDCDLVSKAPPECINSDDSENIDNEITDKTYYKIVKRQISSPETKKTKSKQRPNIRIKLYTRIGRKLGIWKKGKTLAENLQKVRNELHFANNSDVLKNRLQSLNIDIRKLKIEEFLKCSDGSIYKKYLCVQCPRGTFHDALFNRCVMCPIGTFNSDTGQVLCTNCPQNSSTRKSGRRHFEDCIPQCPPGTAAKIKTPRKKSRPDVVNMKSLMPFCRKCNPGEYQSAFDQTNCDSCPFGHTSVRGSKLRTDCIPKSVHPCRAASNICGPFGTCIPESNDDTLYHCLCSSGYDGAHCELKVDLCLSAPCYNNGVCNYINSSAIDCVCLAEYTGRFCEELRSSCQESSCLNSGTCVETSGNINCECPPGYEGNYCERQVDYCRFNLCENGRCENTPDGYQCKCPPGVIGKRCHLRPCDYLPCHRNAICIDLPHFPATQDSYMCKCPVGLKGYDCSQSHNPCNIRPCKNNGKCTPVALRTVGTTDFNEDKYREYTCKCPPYFYGKNCEVLTTPDFYVKFSKPSLSNYIKLKGPEKNLKEISFCAWIQTSDSFNYGTVLSYATLDSDNMLTFTDYNGFVLYVHGQHIITDIVVNDGIWHFVCVAWASINGFYEIYLDGQLHLTGLNLSANSIIEKDGVLIIGQEQDELSGDFSESESFVGNIAYLDVWDNFIKAAEVKEFYSSCEPYRGNLYAWTDFKMGIQGTVETLPTNFCRSCNPNLRVANGQVQVIDGKAFYRCDDGYKIHGNIMRKCLRTSNWSTDIPFCTIVTCKPLEHILNGFISYESLTYGGFAKYSCQGGYVLDGNDNRICLSNGQWSGTTPQCISKVRCPLIKLPRNATITYGTESGPVNASSLLELDVGSFAEIMCTSRGSTIEGFLTCTEKGQWDTDIPSCDGEKELTEINSSPTHNYREENTKLTTTSIPLPATTVKYTTGSPIVETPLLTTSTPDAMPTITYTPYKKVLDPPNKATTVNQPSNILPSTEQPETISSTENASSLKARISTPTTPLSDNYPNDKFWIALKRFLVSECKHKLKQSALCLVTDEIISLRNHTKLEALEVKEYMSIDVKLFDLLKDHIKGLHSRNPEVTFDNFLKFILDDSEKESHLDKLSDEIKDSLRSILTLPNAEEATTTESIILIPKPSLLEPESSESMEVEDGLSQESQEEVKSTTEFHDFSTTEIVEHCNLKDIPEKPFNGIINRIMGPDNKTIISDLGELREYSIFAPFGTIAQYGCAAGLAIVGNSAVTCREDGTWDPISYICKEMFCDKPPRPVSMNHHGSSGNVKIKFKFGDKIRLHCNEGHVLHGNPEIVCNPPGKWSKVLARCAKISCNKPRVPSNAEIIKGRSYLFEDKILIECEDGDVQEIHCQSNGKWSSSEICS